MEPRGAPDAPSGVQWPWPGFAHAGRTGRPSLPACTRLEACLSVKNADDHELLPSFNR